LAEHRDLKRAEDAQEGGLWQSSREKRQEIEETVNPKQKARRRNTEADVTQRMNEDTYRSRDEDEIDDSPSVQERLEEARKKAKQVEKLRKSLGRKEG
jgi:hypothetical protein